MQRWHLRYQALLDPQGRLEALDREITFALAQLWTYSQTLARPHHHLDQVQFERRSLAGTQP